MTAPRLGRPMALIAVLLFTPALASAQSSFDMSTEEGGVPAAPPSGPAPPPATIAAPQSGPLPFDMSLERGGKPVAPSPAVSAAAAGAEASGQPPATPRIDRFLVAASDLRFEGEIGRRKWGFALTNEQARRPATLAVALNSSIYVAPEDSRLRITINDRLVVDEPLAAHEKPAVIKTPVPADTLKPGANVIAVDVTQRHRTDCTIQSTYDLWTEIDGPGTGLIFDGADPTMLAGLDDLPAVGFDGTGTTNIRLIVPGGERAFAEPDLAKLVQAIALRGGFRQPVVTVDDGTTDGPPAGTLRLAVGSARELAALIPGLPTDAALAPTVGFAGVPGTAPTLIVSGPTWTDVKAAMGYISDPVSRPPDVARATIDTTPWLLPPVPMIVSDRTLTLSDLDVKTVEFSGRRFHTEFYVGLPADFYSEAYGEATLYLDAAYTDAVRPGSHVDVYVNGFVAANTPLTSRNGDILQHLPIKVAMTDFRPGVNKITIEAILDTEADTLCAPGSAAGGPDRFALFDTSAFHMPGFGRISRWPDLSALVGAGAPYAESTTPVQIILGRSEPAVYSAALTFLARLAISAARPIPVEMGRPDALGDRPAIFVGALGQFSPATVAEFAIADTARTEWEQRPKPVVAGIPIEVDPRRIIANEFGPASTSEDIQSRWENELVNPSGIRGRWFEFERWLERTFDLSLNSLSVTSGPDAPFNPSNRATLVVAQAPKSANRAWTMVGAPTAADLADGIAKITTRRFWAGLNGRIAAYDDATGVETVPAHSERYDLSSGLSLQNLRLIAANWLSVNIVLYAVALVVLCIILGISTSALLSRLGRPS